MSGFKLNKILSLQNVTIFLIPVIYLLFYCYVGFDLNILKLIMFISSVFMVLFFIANNNRLNCFELDSYGRYISILMVIVAVSMMNAFIYWGQSPVATFRAGASIIVFIYYFILKKYNVSIEYVNTLIMIFAAIYVVLWLYAVSQAPRVVFGLADEIDDARGFYRASVPGIYFVALAYFVFLQRAIDDVKGLRLLWIGLSVASFFVVFLSMSRTLFLGLIIFSLYYLLRSKPFLFACVSVFLYFGTDKIIQDSEILSTFSYMTTNEMDNAKYGSRTAEYSNFLKVYPFHVGTTLFGNGSPHVISEYGKREESLKANVGFNRSDSGWVDFYVTYGLISVILILSLAKKVFKQNKPSTARPYELFIYYLLFSSITGSAITAGSSALVMALYILEQYRTNNIYESSDVCLR